MWLHIATSWKPTIGLDYLTDGNATEEAPRSCAVDAESVGVDSAVVLVAVLGQMLAGMSVLGAATDAAASTLVFRKPVIIVLGFTRHAAPT